MKFDFENPEHRNQKLQRIRAGCAEMPPPPESNLPDKCWIASTKIDDDFIPINDYTTGKLEGESRGLHVITWMLANGIKRKHSEDGLEVMHLCNRKACGNPAHLVLGTRKENNDAAIADGLFDPQGQKGIPRPWQLGEKNVRAKATESQIAEIKWLLKNREQWWTPALRSRYKKIDTVLAIVYGLTEASIKQTRRGKSWPEVEPVKPTELPTAEKIPMDAKPPRPKKGGPIGPENAALILCGYWQAKDKPDYITEWLAKLNVERLSIQNVLIGKTWREVEPHIPRETDFSSHRQKLSDRAVQQIRATFAADPTVHGLQAALARKFACEDCSIGMIVRRLARLDVPDDPAAIIPLEELEFKPTAQRGEAHKGCKLSDEQSLKVLERNSAGESMAKLALELGVSYQTIWKGVTGRTRRDIWERFHRERREREQDGENVGGE